MKKINTAMALRWFIFLPFIFVVSVVLGAAQGIYSMLGKVFSRMWKDIEMDA